MHAEELGGHIHGKLIKLGALQGQKTRLLKNKESRKKKKSLNGISWKQVGVSGWDCCQTRFVSTDLFTAGKLASHAHTDVLHHQSFHSLFSFCLISSSSLSSPPSPFLYSSTFPSSFYLRFCFSLSTSSPCIHFPYPVNKEARKMLTTVIDDALSKAAILLYIILRRYNLSLICLCASPTWKQPFQSQL